MSLLIFALLCCLLVFDFSSPAPCGISASGYEHGNQIHVNQDQRTNDLEEHMINGEVASTINEGPLTTVYGRNDRGRGGRGRGGRHGQGSCHNCKSNHSSRTAVPLCWNHNQIQNGLCFAFRSAGILLALLVF